MSEEKKKKGFFARLGLGQSNGGGCNCGVQIVSEEEALRQQSSEKQAQKNKEESDKA